MNLKILHLSDLHISTKEEKDHEMLRNQLLFYVGEKIHDIDAVVFTGDLIDRADMAAFDKGMDFLTRLSGMINVEPDRFVIVPGNHDMERSGHVSGVLQSILEPENHELSSPSFYDNAWKYIAPRMDKYAEFMDKMKLVQDDSNRYGIGVKVIEKNGCKVCFNMLNSAWTSQGKTDYGKLLLGKWQLEMNRQRIEENPDHELVITLMHHPFSWLTDQEAELLRDYMRNESKFDSPIILHGHIHDAKMMSEEVPGKKIVSLVSGIGYPDADNRSAGCSKISSCRFSVYEIDTNHKSVDCFYYKSLDSGKFIPDNELYDGSEDGHYYMSWGSGNIVHDHATIGSESNIYEIDPCPAVNCWSGREDELSQMNGQNHNVIYISGVGGQGKTALAAQFFNVNAEKMGFSKRVWVDCKEMVSTMHVKLMEILEVLSDQKRDLYAEEPLKQTIKRFLNHMKQERYLVVFDNIDAYVNIETSELAGELRDLVEMLLTQANRSLTILTCRYSIYDSHANFKPIKLDGLKEPEGMDFVRNRGISLETEEEQRACKEIIRRIKGHPWWLGLICGQILLEKCSMEQYLSLNQDDLLSKKGEVKKYFEAIWKKLGERSKGAVAQEIIRMLSVCSRPLNTKDLSNLTKQSFKKTNEAIRLLNRLSLLIEHKGEENNITYQVHPLVKEYVKYVDETQQNACYRIVVEYIIGHDFYNLVFASGSSDAGEMSWNTDDIIDSVETCLTAEKYSDALALLSVTHSVLCDGGRVTDFLSLSTRTLEAIDWAEDRIAMVEGKIEFIAQYFDMLSVQNYNKEKLLYFLNLYEKNCEEGTKFYVSYLENRANALWRIGEYKEAYQVILRYNELKGKSLESYTNNDMQNLYGAILRDMGNVAEALKVFENNLDCPAKVGNIAKCYILLGETGNALSQLGDCLKQLEGRSDLQAVINTGYAYLWIAECYDCQGDEETAKLFLIMAQEVWKECAPGLLYKTEELQDKLGDMEMPLDSNTKENALKKLLGSSAIS